MFDCSTEHPNALIKKINLLIYVRIQFVSMVDAEVVTPAQIGEASPFLEISWAGRFGVIIGR